MKRTDSGRIIVVLGSLIVGAFALAGSLCADSPELVLTPTQPLTAMRKAMAAQHFRAASASIIRQYDFGDVDPELLTCQNEATLEDTILTPMRYVSSQPLTVIEEAGDFRSVRLDYGCFESAPFDVDPEQGFTVELLFRQIGHGSVDGGSSRNGMLFALGDGYWHGLRCYYDEEQKSLSFQIGRPQPSSAITAFARTTLIDGVWTRLLCSWDGQVMRVYVNGVFVGRQDFDGPFSVADNMKFKVGYAGAGVGSNEMDVAEVSVYDGALASDQIVANACDGGSLEGDVAGRLQNALAAIESGENDAALAAIDSLLESGELPEAYAAHLTYLKAELLYRIGRRSECVAQCLDVWRREDFDPSLRRLAGLRLIAPDPGAVRVELSSDVYRELIDSLELEGDALIDASLSLITALEAEDRLEEVKSVREALLASTEDLTEEQVAKIVFDAFPPEVWRDSLFGEAGDSEWSERVRAVSSDFDDLAASMKTANGISTPTDDEVWPYAGYIRSSGIVCHVSPHGDDQGNGSETAPFHTLSRARDAIRSYVEANGRLPEGGVEVRLHDGVYECEDTFVLDAQDSGEEGRPIVYRAWANEKVVLTGGVELSCFEPVADTAILSRLPEPSRGRVYQCDLPAQGVTDFGRLNVRGMGAASDPVKPWVDLYANGKAMPLARWPNPGEPELKVGETYRGAFQTSEANGPAEFTCSHPQFTRWRSANDIWMDGMWGHLWAAKKIPVEKIDEETGRIHTGAGSGYGVRTGQPLHFINLLEEIDQPGEWYLDRESGILYFYPPEELEADADFPTVQFPLLEQPFITMTDVHNVAIIGLSFELNRSDAIITKDCEDCMIAGCSIRRVGGNGIVVRNGRNIVLYSNDLISLGAGGIRLSGGDRATLQSSECVVRNCVIEDFSRVDRSYAAAIHIDGVGMVIKNNRIGNSPHYGLRIEGDLHTILSNEFHHLVLEFDDQAAIDMWGDPTYRGNRIMLNYFHDIGSGHTVAGQSGIRLDDAISSTLIVGNLFERSADGRFGAVQIHGGKDNLVVMNMFLDCQYGVSFSQWGKQRWADTLARPDFAAKIERGTNPLRLQAFPDLADIPSHADRNFIVGNRTTESGPFITRDRGVNVYLANHALSLDFFKQDHNWDVDSFTQEIGPQDDPYRQEIPPISLPN